MNQPCTVDIVITTYNGQEHLPQLLESIQKQSFGNMRCFVIDDHSSDDTVYTVGRDFPWVQLIIQRSNCGPSHNRNVAAWKGNAQYIIFLDDDVMLKDSQWLAKGVSLLESNPNWGQLATMVVSGFDEEMLLDCGIKAEGPTFGGIFFKEHQEGVLGLHLVSRKVLGACSAGTFVRRDVFELIGGFDSKYYYMGEDLDLSTRIHLAGYDVIYVPDLVTHHFEGQAMRRDPRRKEYFYFRNCLLVLLENYPFVYALRMILRQKAGFLRSFFHRVLKKTRSQSPSSFIKTSVWHVNKEGWKAFNMIQGYGWLLMNIPRIVYKRLSIECYRRRPRQYLIDLNRELEQETTRALPVRSLIFQITNKCNAACKMCFLLDELNKPAQTLTLEEIRLFNSSMPQLSNVVLGGGEPFLREDIDRICQSFIENHPQVCITIPTNAYHPERIYKKTKRILALGGKNLVISLSLDGMEEYHDENRKIKGLFKNVELTYQKLHQLRNLFGDKLEIQVNTCITAENFNQLKELSIFIREHMPDAYWVFEPVRGNFDKQNTGDISIDQWRFLVDQTNVLTTANPAATDRLKVLLKTGIEAIQKRTQPIPCTGGDEFIAIDYAGNISPCEILPRSGINLRDLDYDINKILASVQYRQTIKDIKAKKCHCTHFCWLTHSLDKAGR